MSGTDGIKSFETLDVQVKALEGDVRDIKTSIGNLGAELRTGLAGFAAQFAQQQKTPWASIGSVGVIFLSVIGFMVFQTITPMQTNIKSLQDEIVPRVEHNFRQDAMNHQFDAINSRFDKAETRKYDELNKTIEKLELENHELKRKN